MKKNSLDQWTELFASDLEPVLRKHVLAYNADAGDEKLSRHLSIIAVEVGFLVTCARRETLVAFKNTVSPT